MDTNIIIRDLLKLEEFQLADIISTQKGLTKNVNLITIMDFPNIDDWVKKNELLIIGFFMETHFNETFVSKLADKEIAGIITKKKFKYCLTPQLIKQLHEANIPVIIVEDKYSWSDVMTPIQSLIIQRQTSMLYESEQFHQTMIQSLFNRQSINDLCSSVHNVTSLTLAIMDQNFNMLDYSYDFDWLNYLQGFSRASIHSWQTIGKDGDKRLVQGFSYQNPICADQSFRLFFLPVYQKQKIEAYIIVSALAEEKELSSEVIAKLQSFQSIYLIKKAFYDEFQKANLQYQNMVFEELLQAKGKEDVDLKQYSLVLGTHLETDYHLILVKGTDTKEISQISAKSENLLAFKESVRKQAFMSENILVFFHQDYWVFLAGKSYYEINDFVKSLNDYLRSFFPREQLLIGVSELQPYWKLGTAWHEAEQAIFFIQNNSASHNMQYYHNLGILKLFTDDFGSINQYYVKQMLDDYVAPLLSADESGQSDLFKTLETYFDNGFSHKKTCDVLFIHKNTLRARLLKVEELLNLSLKNADNLMNLHLALRLYQMMPRR